MTRILMCVALLGCAGSENTDESDTDSRQADATARLATWLSGDFDSSDQAQADANYFAIRMQICAVDLPELGEHVLYVEQAQVSDQDNPYRQRLYLIEAGPSDDQAISRIYTLANNGAVKGLCQGEGSVPAASTATEKVGCAVTMTWNGEGWVGGTTGTDCPTTLGGDYTTSEITITPTLLTSWDRGFNADGSQAWGAVGGGYQFVRRSEPPAE